MLRHLHSHPDEHALWLDTTSSFSAEFGHEILQSITAQRTVPLDSSVSSSENLNGSMLPDQPHKSHEASAAKDDAPSALDRLIVAKVFDLQSAIQAIQQVRAQRFEKIEDEPKREESNLPTNGRNEDEVKAADSEATIYSDVVPETGMLAMDMLLQSSDDRTTETNNLGEPSDHKRQTDTVPDQPTSEAKPSHLRFIIIDSIAALLKGVLTATSAEGHARMISFMRLLRSFTSVTLNGQHLFTTIFAINGLVSLASTANSNAALQSVFPMLNTKRVKAALGPTFTYLTDWTIYLSHATDVFHGANGLPAEMEADGRRSLICEVVRSRRMVSTGCVLV